MHPFGGPQRCARCDKTVYAAEQAMGPGRKLYHKPCLTCTTCNKRLDSLSLLEHDFQPYCKICHTKNFGTKDLRAANLPHRDPTSTYQDPVPESPRKIIAYPDARDSSSPSPPPRVASPLRQSNTGSFSLKPTRTLMSPTSPTYPSPELDPPREADEDEELEEKSPPTQQTPQRPPSPSKPTSTNGFPLPRGRFPPPSRTGPLSPTRSLSPNRTGSRSPSPTRAMLTGDNSSPSPSSSYAMLRAQSTGATTTPSRYGATMLGRSNSSVTASQVQNRPIFQTSTGTRYGAALGGGVGVNVTGTPTGGGGGGSPRKWGGTNPSCPRCGKSVYFAEQVKAVGKTYHKGCLRCTECGTSLDSNRLRDHNGEPYCVRCHNKHHGPQGAGYALLGKAGG